jgi:hypothetical protein
MKIPISPDAPSVARNPYAPPSLKRLGRVFEVTRKSGGSEDGFASMMEKSGGG